MQNCGPQSKKHPSTKSCILLLPQTRTLTLTQTNLQQPLRCTAAALRHAIRKDHKWVEKIKWQSNNAGAHVASEFANIIRTIVIESQSGLSFFFFD